MKRIKIGDVVTCEGLNWIVTALTRGRDKLARLSVPGDLSLQNVIYRRVEELENPGPWR
jgi:hypothetical protein